MARRRVGLQEQNCDEEGRNDKIVIDDDDDGNNNAGDNDNNEVVETSSSSPTITQPKKPSRKLSPIPPLLQQEEVMQHEEQGQEQDTTAQGGETKLISKREEETPATSTAIAKEIQKLKQQFNVNNNIDTKNTTHHPQAMIARELLYKDETKEEIAINDSYFENNSTYSSTNHSSHVLPGAFKVRGTTTTSNNDTDTVTRFDDERTITTIQNSMMSAPPPPAPDSSCHISTNFTTLVEAFTVPDMAEVVAIPEEEILSPDHDEENRGRGAAVLNNKSDRQNSKDHDDRHNDKSKRNKYRNLGSVCIFAVMLIMSCALGVSIGLLKKKNSNKEDLGGDDTKNDDIPNTPTNTVVVERTLQIIHSNENESGFQDVNTLEEKILHYSSLVKGLRMLNIPASIHLSAGDLTIPGLFYDAASEVSSLGNGGLGDITMLNAMGINAVTLGNQDLASGIDDFANLLTHAQFPYLSVNLDLSQVILSKDDHEDETPEIIIGPDASLCKNVAGQVVKSCYIDTDIGKVGIIGRSPSGLFFLISDPETSIPGLDFVGGRDPETDFAYLDSAILIKEQVQKLENIGVDIIILLDQDFSNVNEIDQIRFSEELKGIDIIVGEVWGDPVLFAQSDSFGPFNYLREGDIATVNYPIVRKDINDNRVLFINTFDSYRYIGNLIVTFDENGVISSWDGRSGPIATTPEAVALMEEVVGTSLEPDPVVKSTLESLQNTPSFLDSFSVLGTTNYALEGQLSEVRSRETNLGRLVADSTLWWARFQLPTILSSTGAATTNTIPHVDIALKNGGGIRSSILGPAITRFSILSALPFDNELAIVELNAGQLIAALENSVSAMPLLDGRTPHLAGIRVEVNITMPAIEGSHFEEIPSRLKKVVLEGKNGGALDKVIIENYTLQAEFVDRKFVVATSGFLASGGDQFQSISDGVFLLTEETTGVVVVGEQQMLEEYIQKGLGGFVNIRDPPPQPHRLVILE